MQCPTERERERERERVKERARAREELTGICPAEEGGLRVIGQAIGQAQAFAGQEPSVGAIHVSSLDLRGLPVPVTPVEESDRHETKV